MASKDAIAAKRNAAIKSINESIRVLAERQGREYPPLPTRGNDKDLVHAAQLTALAGILADVVKEGEHATATSKV